MSTAGPVTPQQVDALWTDLIKNPQVRWPATPLRLALDLFSDACKAFKVNANLGTAVLRRAAVEAACLIYLTYRREGSGGLTRIDIPRRLDGRIREVSWWELRGGVAGFFSKDEMENIDRIVRDGNTAAHLGDRYLKWVEGLMASSQSLTAGSQPQPAPPIPFVSQSEAWSDLRDTKPVLERLCVDLFRS